MDWFLYDRNLCHEEVTLKSFLDHKLKGKHCMGEEFQKLAVGKKTVDKDILITSKNGDRKIIQSIRITSECTSYHNEKVESVQQFSQFRWASTRVILTEDLNLLRLDYGRGVQDKQQMRDQYLSIPFTAAF